jgi:hypothetical protein
MGSTLGRVFGMHARSFLDTADGETCQGGWCRMCVIDKVHAREAR